VSEATHHNEINQAFQTIVVGVDLSPESLCALDLAATIAQPQGAALRIVHVHHRPATLAFSPAASLEFARAEDETDAAIRETVTQHLTGFDGQWTITSRNGHISQEIRDEADDTNATLIVIGHQSHSTIHDAILGSVAASIVHHSRRSVLVAVPPTRDSDH
jgi:nucleotide-binding universal stress UspA family protein